MHQMSVLRRSSKHYGVLACHTTRTLLPEVNSNTYLPFLYRTPTILRQYSSQDGDGLDQLLKESSSGSRTRDAPITLVASEDKKHRRNYEHTAARRAAAQRNGLSERGSQDRHGASTRRSSRYSESADRMTSSMGLPHLSSRFESQEHQYGSPDTRRPRGQQGSAVENFVPFEGVVEQPASIGSSLTPKELHTFERLFEAGKKKGAFTGSDMTLDSILDAAVGRGPDISVQETRPIVKERARSADLAGNTPVSDEPAANNAAISLYDSLDKESKAVMKMFRKIRSSIVGAQTDAELWQVLQEQIFAKVKALRLDDPAVDEERRRRRLEIQKQNDALRQQFERKEIEAYEPLVAEDDVVYHWSQNFPVLMPLIMKTFEDNFPGSQFSAAILPALRALGPSEFTLGASTSLYNRHMSLLYRRHGDIDGVVRILEEMDRAVYPFDRSTYALITRILVHSQAAMTGKLGAGQQIQWTMEHKQRGIKAILKWSRRIKRRMGEDALRKAQAEEVETINGLDTFDGPQLAMSKASAHRTQDRGLGPVEPHGLVSHMEEKYLGKEEATERFA